MLTFADALNSRYEPENESIANSPALISSFLDERYKKTSQEARSK